MEVQAGIQFGREAYVYLFPIVKIYLSIYQFTIDTNCVRYKSPTNRIRHVVRAFTPDDPGLITRNSDTAYSFLVMDLRTEPIVVTMPAVDKGRYCSLQIVDLFTHNVDYLGTRVDGNKGGDFLIVSPGWIGEVPAGISRVVRVATELAYAHIRTQLFGPDDIDEVKQVQSRYAAQTLSAFLKRDAKSAAVVIDWPAISEESFDRAFWQYANFLLPFCPALPAETALRTRFKAVGLGEASHWPPTGLDPVFAQDVVEGGGNGRRDIEAFLSKITTSVGVFGQPDEMAGKYLARAAGAMDGNYGNSVEEEVYYSYSQDVHGKPLDSGQLNYRLGFLPGELPPVDAFWSVTMYDAIGGFLIRNPLDRYLINSTMLDTLARDPDGGVTLYLQHESPGAGLETNWLPAPDGPMAVAMRLYMPRAKVALGAWDAPPITRVNKITTQEEAVCHPPRQFP